LTIEIRAAQVTQEDSIRRWPVFLVPHFRVRADLVADVYDGDRRQREGRPVPWVESQWGVKLFPLPL
jgi:hypothetical protein